MLKFLSSILDKIVFTVIFIIGVQLPEFIQQYIQRLSGHLDEAKHHLAQFQHIADIQFQGNLQALIERYNANADSAIQQTGQLVDAMLKRIEAFELHITALHQPNYFDRTFAFISQLDLTLAQATYLDYQLAIPLELTAILTGVSFALLMIFLQKSVYHTGRYLVRKVKSSKRIDNKI